MKKTYLTFDIETIVSGISRSSNYLAGVYLGAMFIANELKKRELKATFYISLSSKQKDINNNEYLEVVKWLVQSLAGYKNIKIEPHLHAFDLPMKFDCISDDFGSYSKEQQVDMLVFAKKFFKELNIDVSSFRPGGFRRNEFYYQSLKEANYQTSSILIKEQEPNIDMLTGGCSQSRPFTTDMGVVEYPVTSVKIKSMKGKVEVVNLSPDFFNIKSVSQYLENLDYINVNFHSFSIYINRLIRENHFGQKQNNIKFLFFENILNRLLNLGPLQLLNSNTIVKNTFVDWLDYIQTNNFETCFIGD